MHVLGIFTLLITISKILAVPEANCSNYYLLIEESMFSFDPVAVDAADLGDLDPHIPRQCYLNLMCGPISVTDCRDTVKPNPKMGKDEIIRDPLNPTTQKPTTTTKGTTALELTTVTTNETTSSKPTTVTTTETTTPESVGVTSNERTTLKPIAATNGTTTPEPTTITNNGSSPLEPTTVATNKITTPKTTAVVINETTPLESTTVSSNRTTTQETTTAISYATTTLKPITTTYKITTLQPEDASEDTDRESLLPERCNKKFKQYILNSDCGERIDKNYKSTVYYQCDRVPYKECTGHDVDEERLENLTRVPGDEAYKKCQHYLIHTKLFDLDGHILYHPLNLLAAKFQDIPCADYNATCILKFECTDIGEYCIRTYRYQGTQTKQRVTRGCFTKKTIITDAPTFTNTTLGTTVPGVTTAKTMEFHDQNIFSAFIKRKPKEDLILLFAFLAIGQLALTMLIYVIVTRIKWKRESQRYEVEANNDTTVRQLPPANIF